MALIVADSDVLIDALAGREPAGARVAAEIRRGTLAATTITVFELLSGARSSRTYEAIERLLRALEIYPLDDEAARTAARIRLQLESGGTPIGMADYLIAGICLARGTQLLTRNREHFARIPDLRLATL